MEAICECLCQNTHLILKKDIPEYHLDDYTELQAASKAVEKGQGDKMETLLKIMEMSKQRNDKKSNIKGKNEEEEKTRKRMQTTTRRNGFRPLRIGWKV